jgi:structural maintenance of chromosomes protein 6
VHVTLRDGAWHKALSSSCSGVLETWIVGDLADQDALQRLAKEVHDDVRRKATAPANFPAARVSEVMVRNFCVPAYQLPADARPGGGYPCALDMLEVSHPTHAHVIRNALIDRCGLEGLALASSDREADEAIEGRHARHAVTRQGRVVKSYGAGVQAMREGGSSRGSRLLRVMGAGGKEATIATLEGRRREAERQLEEAKRREAAAEKSLREAVEDKATCLRERRDANAIAQRCKREVHEADLDIRETQAQFENPGGGADDDDDDDDDADQQGGDEDGGGGSSNLKRRLIKQLNSARARLERAESAFQAAATAEQHAKQAMKTAALEHAAKGGLSPDEVEETQARLSKLNDERLQLIAMVKDMETTLARLEREAEQLKPVVEAAERELLAPILAAARAVCDDAQGALDLVTGKAVCLDAARRRLDGDTGKRIAKLTPEQKHERAVKEAKEAFCAEWMCEHLDALDTRLREAEEAAGGSRDAIEHECAMVKLEIRKQAGVVRNLSATNDAVQAQVTRREAAYSGLFASVEQTVRHKFELFMARRHHNGTIKIHKDDAALDILVVPNGARGGGGGGGGGGGCGGGGRGGTAGQHARDLRQLSGGERSFTTVAFMLALGEWTESPFRAADELDVFMDAVNRRVAMEAVLEFAAERDHLQMVLLTPQDLQAVEDAKSSLARRRARRARQARRQQQQEEEEAEAAQAQQQQEEERRQREQGGRGRRGGGAAAAPREEDEDDDVDEDEAAAAALPDGFVRVLKMPAARDAGGVRGVQRRAAAAAGGGGDDGDD